jgi:hypothetical protein
LIIFKNLQLECIIHYIIVYLTISRYKVNGPVTTTEFRMHRFNDRVREVPKISPDIILGRYFEIMTGPLILYLLPSTKGTI